MEHLTPARPADISEAEWQVRVDLAACYRLVAKYGMSDLIYNHITAKVPGSDGHFLINPFGLLYTEMTASCFYTLDWDGNIVRQPDTESGVAGPPQDADGPLGGQRSVGARLGINRAGYLIHSAIHKARKDLTCVMHTHTRAGMAVSAMQQGLLPLTQTSMRFYNAIGYHDYEVPTADVSERDRIAEDLGPHNALVLRNHGLIACGKSVQDTWNLMYWLETACKVQVDVLGSGATPHLPSHELASRMAERYKPDGGVNFAPMEWPALLRQLDREDPSYKT